MSAEVVVNAYAQSGMMITLNSRARSVLSDLIIEIGMSDKHVRRMGIAEQDDELRADIVELLTQFDKACRH